MKLFKLAAILIAIPLLALGVGTYYEYTIDQQMQKEVRSAHPDADPGKLAALTIENLIFHPETYGKVDFEPEIYLFVVMKYAAIFTGLLGLLLLVGAVVSSRIAAFNRDFLARLFPVTVGAASVLMSAITIVNGLLLACALYYGESALIGRVHLVIIGLIGIGAIFGSFVMVYSLYSAFKSEPFTLNEEPISHDHPTWKLVDTVAQKLGTTMPDVVIVGQANTFFAFEGKLRINNQDSRGRLLYLSREISERLTLEELSSIIAHEFAHFIGKDLEYTTKFHFGYRALGQAMEMLGKSADGWMLLARLPTLYYLSFLFECFGTVERRNSRERELAADAMACNAYGSKTFGSGLVRAIWYMNLHDRAINALLKEFNEKAGAPEPTSEEVRSLISNRINELATTETENSREALFGQQQSHPFDTHPTMSERLSAAGLDASELVPKVIVIN